MEAASKQHRELRSMITKFILTRVGAAVVVCCALAAVGASVYAWPSQSPSDRPRATSDVPPQFSPDNPAPTAPVAEGSVARELWRLAVHLDLMMQRVAGMPNPPCSDPCLRDDSPDAVIGVTRSICAGVATGVLMLATFEDVPSAHSHLAEQATRACQAHDGTVEQLGPPDALNPDWRAVAEEIHRGLEPWIVEPPPATGGTS
jgi:hypothetical protein